MLLGCTAIAFNLSSLIVSIIFGATVTLCILLFRKKSGAHFNPAVSLTFYLLNRMSLRKLFLYFVVQFVGALFAVYLIYFFQPNLSTYGSTHFSIPTLLALSIETFLCLTLLMTILLSAANPLASTPRAAALIGLCVGLCAYFGGPYTGASMNPARSIAPAIIEANLAQQWLYILTSIIAAFIAAKIFFFLKGKI